jgi:hypothetical protein
MAALAFSLAPAQNRVTAMLLARMGYDAGIVVDQPCHVVEEIDTVRTLPDGTTIQHRVEEMKWRDAQGRFRKQAAEIEEGSDPVFRTAGIVDPVNDTLTVLNFDRKRVIVFHLPDHGPGSLKAHVDAANEPIFARPGVQVKVEKLAGKYIDGVYAVGRRMTRVRPPETIGNDKTIVSVSERRVSPELQIVMAESMNDPRERQTIQVLKVDRSAPDPSVFAIPSGFTVKEVPAAESER